MNKEYEPAPDFVGKTMARIRTYEGSKKPLRHRPTGHFFLRYAVAGGGTLFGILNAAVVF
jgi:hypothetical protein